MHHLTVAVILRLDTNICGDKVYREFFSEPNSSPHEVRGAKQLQILQLPPLVCEFLNEAAVDSRY